MAFPQRYEQLINFIVGMCPGPDKFAHVNAGIALWLGSALILRRPLHSLWPLTVIIVLEVANEVVDFFAHDAWHWQDTIADAVATWFWPLVLSACLSGIPGLVRLRIGSDALPTD